MKKKTILCLTGFIFMFIIVGGVFMFMRNRNKEMPDPSQNDTLIVNNEASVKEVPVPSQNGTLIINNGAAITENVVIHFKESYMYADLPFTEVMKELGMTVDWLDSDVAEITYNDEKYILNLAEVSLVKDGSDSNILIPPPGCRIFDYKVLDKELILDSDTIHSILYTIRKINVSIDREKLIVYITERTD